MHIKPLKTHLIQVGESLNDILNAYVPPLEEGSILAITSKIISLCQGRVVDKEDVGDKYALIEQEADAYLSENERNAYDIYLTITNGILIPSAGIDESNGNGVYILFPEDIQDTATLIWNTLRQRDKIDSLGIIITDSHTTPLRRGVTGISLGWCGFEPLYSYVGKPDIYGTNLRVTHINNLDALAASSVLLMGEGAEQTPLALITQAPRIKFLARPPSLEEINSVQIPLKEDLYAPLLEGVKWTWRQCSRRAVLR
ncbi:MAG: F420-dependent oxidoreductase [Alphaproteobacteria bacterium 41-28]|nr:MAG: F420-dependent oxidoreductase [Alphaproteobacteria bacterium 41-28]